MRVGGYFTPGRGCAIAVALAASALALPVAAPAHVERPGYWPDPAPDEALNPPAGGEVPKARSLASALKAKPPGKTRVVCQDNSLRRLKQRVRRARRNGYDIRPTDHRGLSKRKARRLMKLNRRLAKRCRFREIQAAVTASGNNDRVVIMPGVYAETTTRAKTTQDPACDRYEVKGDRPGATGALSYAYQFHCPNDQNLIAVLGRLPGTGADPDPPRWSRHGIPNLGRCIRCNLQIEGSGVGADDVVIDAGKVEAGNRGPSGVGSQKDVAIRADRADGFVLRNLTTRHAKEHNIYVLESDGYLLDRFKTFYPGLYGVLTFVEDHGLIQNCEAVGGGDSGLYPGAPVDSGFQRPPGTRFRLNQEVRRCDMHHNLAGYSATNGNAVHVHHNEVYDNSLGIQTDVATGAGHPGYPGDSSLFERNNIYSNNFNPYEEGSDVEAAFPYPVGTGMWIAGGNHHTVRENRFWDNWRRGTMLFAVPDTLVCGPDSGNRQAGCDSSKVSTSHYNSYYDNVMGIAPDGRADPNGLDFWWDSFPGNKGNCWYSNTGAKPIATSPEPLPDCDNGQDPAASVGKGDPANEGELAGCFVAFSSGNYDPATCPWFATPPEPGTSAAREAESAEVRARRRRDFIDFCEEAGTEPTCEPFESLLNDR